MSDDSRIYFARRAQEEEERARSAASDGTASIHRQLQRAYLERALIGDRAVTAAPETVG